MIHIIKHHVVHALDLWLRTGDKREKLKAALLVEQLGYVPWNHKNLYK